MPPLMPQRNMQLIRHPERFDAPLSAVAIGNFDGLHRGHREVLRVMQEAASAHTLAPSVLTFEPHPRRVFAPQAPHFRIEPLAQKLRRLRALGVAQVFMPRFTRDFAALSAEQFLDDVLGRQLNARAVVTGEDFAFGKGRAGDVALLKRWGAAQGVAVHTVPALMAEGEVCSSSTVRHALGEGDVAHACALLGHPYRLEGRVMHGDKRGRTLGVPTANIALPPGLRLPRYGIYACWAFVDGVRYMGAASLGVRPTIGGQERPSLEVHLLDFAGEIYGQRVAVDFLHWVRGEEKFDSLDALTDAMQRDCQEVRERLQAMA